MTDTTASSDILYVRRYIWYTNLEDIFTGDPRFAYMSNDYEFALTIDRNCLPDVLRDLNTISKTKLGTQHVHTKNLGEIMSKIVKSWLSVHHTESTQSDVGLVSDHSEIIV